MAELPWIILLHTILLFLDMDIHYTGLHFCGCKLREVEKEKVSLVAITISWPQFSHDERLIHFFFPAWSLPLADSSFLLPIIFSVESCKESSKMILLTAEMKKLYFCKLPLHCCFKSWVMWKLVVIFPEPNLVVNLILI